MLNRLLRLIFPPKCIFCGAMLKPSEPDVCQMCMDAVLLDGEPAQRVNGAFFDSAVGALRYEGNVRKALHRFKFSGKQSYAVPLARVLAFALDQKDVGDFDLIVSVPTNRKNVRKRGYNHADLLGRELARLTGRPYIDVLAKSRETVPMFGLKQAERRANVLGAFSLKCRPEDIEGRRVLLVDDVITTGATLSECARILKENGAAAVLCAAAASAPRKNLGASPQTPQNF